MPTKALSKAQEFTRDARHALEQLKAAINDVLIAAGLQAARPTAIARAMDLNYALAWQLHSLVTEPELLVNARHVPKPGAMERFLTAADKHARGPSAVAARAAYAKFLSTVSDLADDRAAFDAMLTLQHPDDPGGLKKSRRTAHQGNSAVWGVTCRRKMHTVVFRVSPDGDFDSLSILGYVGLRALRVNALVSTLAATRTWATGTQAANRAKADVECELIAQACTRPLPEVQSEIGPDGTPQEFLQLDGLGKKAETTVYWRTVAHAVPGATAAPPHNVISTVRVPAERLVLDLLLPAGWVEGKMTAWITPDAGRFVESTPSARHQLPFEGVADVNPQSIADLNCAATPGHGDLIMSELERLGWTDSSFQVYRCEINYPVVYSVVNLRVE